MKNINFLFLFAFSLALCAGWKCTQPVEIISVHYEEGHYDDILVKNFPTTKRGKIAWWKKNRAMLKEKYGIPHPDENGIISVAIWDFAKGYKEMPKRDSSRNTKITNLVCFDKMQVRENCIEKNWLMDYINSSSGHHYLYIQGGVWQEMPDGSFKRVGY